MLVLCVEVFDRMLADGTFVKLLQTLRLDLSSSNTQSVRVTNCMQSSISAAVSIRDSSNGMCDAII